MSKIVGHISQVIGPVVDVHFNLEGLDAEVALPKIHDAMTVVRKDGRTLIIEVQQHIGEDTVRTVAMDSTDGLKRGMEVVPTGQPITMPVGAQIRGRVNWIRRTGSLYTASLHVLRIWRQLRKYCLQVLRLSTFWNHI